MLDARKPNNSGAGAPEGAFVQVFDMPEMLYLAGLVLTMKDPKGSGLVFEYAAFCVDEDNGTANWYGDEEAIGAALKLGAALGKIRKGR